MPFAGFDDWDDCMDTMTEEEGYDKETAEQVCGALQAEHEKEQGNPEKLLNAINNGAKNILNELGLKNFSFVDNPAQPSKFVRMKSDDEIKVENKLVRKEDKDDWSVVYGAVMIPNEKDKQGDVIPAHTIEEAAHQFLKEKRTDEIDSEHKLITNKGNLVESWILEEDKKYKAVDGEEITYEEGTWMVGVEPKDEIKQKIESGELKGFSIYGQADGVKIDKLQKDDSDTKKDDEEDLEDKNKNKDKDLGNKGFSFGDFMDEDEIKQMKQDLNEIKESFEEFKEFKEELKMQDNEEEETKEDGEPEKQESEEEEEKQEFEDIGDVIDWLDENAPDEVVEIVQDAMQSAETDEDEDDDMEDEEEKEEDKESKSKGHSGEGTRKSVIEEKEEEVEKGMKSITKMIKESE